MLGNKIGSVKRNEELEIRSRKLEKLKPREKSWNPNYPQKRGIYNPY
jgi:hypothetical protein